MKNKKLFAILTLVCFMMTLMPVAAFAAPTDFSVTASVFATEKKDAEISKAVYNTNGAVDTQASDSAKLVLTYNAVNGGAYETQLTSNTYVWVESTANEPSDALYIAGNNVRDLGNGVYEIQSKNQQYDNGILELDAYFLRAGEYTLQAGMENPLAATKVSDVVNFKSPANYNKVVVTAAAQDTTTWTADVVASGSFKVNNADVTVNGLADGESTAKDHSTTLNIPSVGVKTGTITLTVKNPNGALITGYPITLDTNSSNIALSDTSLTTNYKGSVEFDVAGYREGDYKIFVKIGDYEAVINVTVGSTGAVDIETVKEPANAIAKDEKVADYANYIQFQLTDINGNVVKNGAGASNAIKSAPDSTEAKYVSFVTKPASSKLKDKNIYLKWDDDKECYTLALNGNLQFDVEGTYEVAVALDNGRTATVKWDVKKFGTPVELVLTYKQEAVELAGTALIDELVYVDADGVKRNAEKDTNLAASGYAIKDFYPEGEGTGDNAIAKGTIVVKPDEAYIGKTINVTAVSERYNLVATTSIKVTADAAELKFASKTGEVNVNNKIDVQIVDADGNKVAPTNVVKSEIYYVVLDKPADAKVSAATASDKDLAAKGAFTMALTSNKVGNVAVQAVAKLTIKQPNSNSDKNDTVVKYYTGTQIFAIGNGSVGDVVVMSIGSNEIIVNDAKGTIDAAPMIQNDRTFVPFRALAEAFGAEVAYDEATQAVTAKLNGVEVVMTIGSATYTVNGTEKTADVAPFINGSRTMVPVRFAAEAFGIKVIPTYNPDGTTADILFNL